MIPRADRAREALTVPRRRRCRRFDRSRRALRPRSTCGLVHCGAEGAGGTRRARAILRRGPGRHHEVPGRAVLPCSAGRRVIDGAVRAGVARNARPVRRRSPRGLDALTGVARSPREAGRRIEARAERPVRTRRTRAVLRRGPVVDHSGPRRAVTPRHTRSRGITVVVPALAVAVVALREPPGAVLAGRTRLTRGPTRRHRPRRATRRGSVAWLGIVPVGRRSSVERFACIQKRGSVVHSRVDRIGLAAGAAWLQRQEERRERDVRRERHVHLRSLRHAARYRGPRTRSIRPTAVVRSRTDPGDTRGGEALDLSGNPLCVRSGSRRSATR